MYIHHASMLLSCYVYDVRVHDVMWYMMLYSWRVRVKRRSTVKVNSTITMCRTYATREGRSVRCIVTRTFQHIRSIYITSLHLVCPSVGGPSTIAHTFYRLGQSAHMHLLHQYYAHGLNIVLLEYCKDFMVEIMVKFAWLKSPQD